MGINKQNFIVCFFFLLYDFFFYIEIKTKYSRENLCTLLYNSKIVFFYPLANEFLMLDCLKLIRFFVSKAR